MDEQKKYVNTKDLVGEVFSIDSVAQKNWRFWNPAQEKFEYSQVPKKGHAPFWRVETNKGTWSASAAQYSQVLLAAESEGMSDVLDKKFHCQSNGKDGIDVRYFFDHVIE